MNFDVVVLSPYPYGTQQDLGGAAKFIRQLVSFMDVPVAVLAQQGEDNKALEDGHITVFPSWKPASYFPFLQVIRFVRATHTKQLLVNFEFNIFGGIGGLFGLILTLLLLRLWGTNLLIIYHPALLNYKEMRQLAPHLHIGKNGFSVLIYTLGMYAYTWLLGFLSHKMIVFESDFKKRLNCIGVPKRKIAVIPHQIYQQSSIGKKVKTNVFEILFFGYIVQYKGLELLLDAIQKLPEDQFHLTVAGGKSPNGLEDEYYETMKRKMNDCKNVTHVGYVPEGEVAHYFAGADIVILPYTQMIASSGPLATAIGYEKPFILSSPLGIYLKTPDAKKAAHANGLTSAALCFEPTALALAKKLRALRRQSERMRRLTRFSRALHNARQPKSIADTYLALARNS